ncbi:MAG: ABC transporter permease [Ruminococcus sp.]|nr:ABC transporter permease [Ruminococcus sp.]
MKVSKVFAVPYAVWVLIFTIIPLGLVIGFALTDSDGNFTLQNLFDMSDYMAVLFRSILFAIIATVICLVLAFPAAYIISRAKSFIQSSLIVLIMVPMWTNFILRTYAWMTLLESNGLINKFLGLFGIGPLNLINTGGAVILGMVYNYLPFMILPLYSVMVKIDPSVIEAAKDLGANNFNLVRRVILPLSMPGINSGIIAVFIPSVSTFVISRMLGGGTSDLIGDIIESQFLGTSYNPHLGSAMALVLMVVVIFLMSLFNQFGSEEEVML